MKKKEIKTVADVRPPSILEPYLDGHFMASKLMLEAMRDGINLNPDAKSYVSSEIDRILKKKQEIMKYYEDHLGDMSSQVEIYKLNKVEIDKKYDEMVGIEKDLIEFLRGVEQTLNKVRHNATYGLWGYKR
nr:MAG TPA: hypothetical protein [Caudoviricetes sp.]